MKNMQGQIVFVGSAQVVVGIDPFCYLLTYSMEQSPSWEANRVSASHDIPTFYETLRFMTVFTKNRHLSLFWARSIQFMPYHPTSWRSKWFLFLNFANQTPIASLLSPVHATCPTYLIILYFVTQIIFGEKYISFSSSLHSVLHSPVTSSLLAPNIILSTLFWNTLSLRSSLSTSNQVSHSYKTTRKIIVLYILIFIFLDSKLEDKGSAPNDSKHSLTSVCS